MGRISRKCLLPSEALTEFRSVDLCDGSLELLTLVKRSHLSLLTLVFTSLILGNPVSIVFRLAASPLQKFQSLWWFLCVVGNGFQSGPKMNSQALPDLKVGRIPTGEVIAAFLGQVTVFYGLTGWPVAFSCPVLRVLDC